MKRQILQLCQFLNTLETIKVQGLAKGRGGAWRIVIDVKARHSGEPVTIVLAIHGKVPSRVFGICLHRLSDPAPLGVDGDVLVQRLNRSCLRGKFVQAPKGQLYFLIEHYIFDQVPYADLVLRLIAEGLIAKDFCQAVMSQMQAEAEARQTILKAMTPGSYAALN